MEVSVLKRGSCLIRQPHRDGIDGDYDAGTGHEDVEAGNITQIG